MHTTRVQLYVSCTRPDILSNLFWSSAVASSPSFPRPHWRSELSVGRSLWNYIKVGLLWDVNCSVCASLSQFLFGVRCLVVFQLVFGCWLRLGLLLLNPTASCFAAAARSAPSPHTSPLPPLLPTVSAAPPPPSLLLLLSPPLPPSSTVSAASSSIAFFRLQRPVCLFGLVHSGDFSHGIAAASARHRTPSSGFCCSSLPSSNAMPSGWTCSGLDLFRRLDPRGLATTRGTHMWPAGPRSTSPLMPVASPATGSDSELALQRWRARPSTRPAHLRRLLPACRRRVDLGQ